MQWGATRRHTHSLMYAAFSAAHWRMGTGVASPLPPLFVALRVRTYSSGVPKGQRGNNRCHQTPCSPAMSFFLQISPDQVRQQINQVTSFMDASMVYGSDEQRARSLRSFRDGKLLVNEAGECPLNTANIDQANPVKRRTADLRMVGDVRGNVTPLLLAYHSLFVREHNRYCDQLKAAHPNWDDEKLYQEARRRVAAHIQHITYREYLPALLGEP